MSHIAEIVAFVSLADGALSPEIQAMAIRRRWPGVTGEEVCEAMVRSAQGAPADADGRAAVAAAVMAILGKARRKRSRESLFIPSLRKA